MRNLSRILSLALVLSLSVTCLCIGSTATSAEPDLSKYAAGSGYLALGDSYTRGMGADAPEETAYQMDKPDGEWVNTDMGYQVQTTKYCRNVNGSFTKIVADTIGCNCPDDITDTNATYWPVAQNGLTTSFFNDLLGIDDGYFDTEYSHNPEFKVAYARYNTDLYYFGNENSVSADGNGVYGSTGICADICDLVKNAGLITIELGMGDILSRTYDLLEKDYLTDDADLSNITTLSQAATTVVEGLWEGYYTWKDIYPQLLQYIIDTNTNGTIVIIGAVNPVSNASLSDELPIPVGTAISAITTLMNQYYRAWAEEYDCIYVDISNTELGVVEYDWSLMGEDFSENSHLATHPTPAGHEQIARQIINALKEKETNTQANLNNIVVDLGRFDTVSYVMVDGKTITNYSVQDNVLTIPVNTHNASNLTIATVENNKISLTTYELVYDNGYTAYRIYTTNNLITLIEKLVSALKSVVVKTFSLIRT